MGPNANLAGVGGFIFAAVRTFCARPAGNGGIWHVIEMESTHVEQKMKAAVYLTNAKQGKSDIWKQLSIVTEKMGKSSTYKL